MREPEYSHHCTIPWTNWASDSLYMWNVIAAEAMELFGLPGDRYITDIGEHSMIWSFKDPRDAVLFKLKFSEAVC